jgi:nucleotide-binding universal stress UspA family protein
MKVLIAIDGSECSLKAARYLIQHRIVLGDPFELTLLHVDQPLVERAQTVLGTQGVRLVHENNAEFALRGAIELFRGSDVEHATAVLVGEPAPRIAQFAEEGHYDLLVMGSHGHGALSGFLLGSIVTKVLALSAVPVLVMR